VVSHTCTARLSVHPLDPLSAPRPGLERIAAISSLSDRLPTAKFHNTHRVGRPPIVSQDGFCDPKAGSVDYPPHLEALDVRSREPRHPNVAPATEAFARLRIFEHCVVSLNLVLSLEVARVGGGPVAIQSRSDFPVLHPDIPLLVGDGPIQQCASPKGPDLDHRPLPTRILILGPERSNGKVA